MNITATTGSTTTLDVGLADLPHHALELWQSTLMLEGLNATAIGTHVREVTDAARQAGAVTVGDLLDRAPKIISAITGVEQISRFSDARTGDQLHAVRNGVGQLAAAAALLSNDNPADALAKLPQLAPRAAGPARTLKDDEILLMRHLVEYAAAKGGRSLHRAATYALAETGLWVSETTSVLPSNFDDLRDPATVQAPGRRSIEARTITLPGWPRRILGIVLDRHLASSTNAVHERLSYSGRAPGTDAATASADGVITRLLSDAHVLDTTGRPIKGRKGYRRATTPDSICAWRIQQTYETCGLAAAIETSGRSAASTLGRITWKGAKPTAIESRQVTSFVSRASA